MERLMAGPGMLKQVNLSLIRKAIKNKGAATRAEIARETRISLTTVRSLLTEMQDNKEIESIGYDESSGGRKAERYRFKADRYYGVAFCIEHDIIRYLIVNICGSIVETGKLQVLNGDIKEPIVLFLDEMTTKMDIQSIGLGVLGVVTGVNYLKSNRSYEFYKVDIGSFLAARYGVPIVLENNLNAIAIGFSLCYEKKFPGAGSKDTNIAFVYFGSGCISAGFIAGGRVIRGAGNYAGELDLIPLEDGKTFAELLAEPVDSARYTGLVTKIICFICAVLNPEYIALGGPEFRKECLSAIGDALYSVLPRGMLAEILYSPDVWHDYYEGMAFLTAAKIFDEVQLVKGQV